MIGLGWMEILIIFSVGCVWIGVVAVVAIVAWRSSQSASRALPASHPAAHVPAAAPPIAPVADDAEMRQTIIARLTQRFCPQCRAALAADSPEGLCPACLMAGGMASVSPVANGMAVTTPPSGSQPPVAGEWADLQGHFPELEILELLGRGGMGAVYKARQKNLDRLVALKVIPPDAAKDPAFVERFNREAKAMARLNHPSIVTVYNFGHEGELCWLVMEYVDGVNLRHMLQASRLAPREALAIVPQICDALQYAHDQGVVHRDIKPENVLLDRTGRVKIADFGLAKLLGKGLNDFTLTRTQQVMGTPRYMAPEQIEKPTIVDHRADIYSLGVVIYEMLTGELPLGRFEPPSHKVQLDVRIDEVVLRTLEKEPDRRYQRASQLKTELASASSWPQAAAANVAAPQAVPPQPSWHTPAPAAKSASFDPGDVPLNQVLGVAFGMVMGVVVITCGLAAGLYGMSRYPLFSGEWWGWAGGGFGSLIGGFGSLFGSYNTYRQMAGAEDLMRSPRVTWFDWVMRGYFALGVVFLAMAVVTFDSGPNVWPLFLLGGIAAFQAGLFLVWRMLVRPAIAAGAQIGAAGPAEPAAPGALRGVFLPAAAVLALLALLWVDAAYTEHNYAMIGGAVSPAMKMIGLWQDVILLAGVVFIPLCLIGLGLWHAWGPRTVCADGKLQVTYPFAARGWVWGVAALAVASLLVPWFCLQVVSNAEIVVPVTQAYSRNGGPNDSLVSFVAKADELRSIAGMPGNFRYAHRGIEVPPAAAACIGIAFAALLVSLVTGPAQWRGIALGMCSVIGLFLIAFVLHDALDNPQWLTVDSRTEAGLTAYLTRARGEHPYSVTPLLPVLRQGFTAQPALGMFLALAAGGLGFFLSVTDLCWGTAAAPDSARTPMVQPKVLDPVREALRRRVAGPAIGLIIAGVIGILPFLIGLLVIPAAIITEPQLSEPQMSVEKTGAMTQHTDAGTIACLTSIPCVTTHGAPAAMTLPLLLAQEMPPQPRMDVMPTWAVLLPLMTLFYLFNLALSITLIVAGWRMRQLKSYGLSLVGAILAVLPCSFGWIIGLPMGIWAFSVLQQPDVRQAFQS